MRVRLSLLLGILSCLCMCWLMSACTLINPRGTSDGLLPGLNYMQPLKWRMTYKYRVQEIFPNQRLQKKRDSALFPGVPAVGKGTWETWFVGPHEGEEIRAVKRIAASPEPTKVVSGKGKDSDLTFVYYDFAPDGYLPQEISATVTFEFITFERYTFWDGVKLEAEDPNSDIYKRYTKEEKPILFHKKLREELAEKVKDIPKDHIQERAAVCYNHLIGNFKYDFDQLWMIPVIGYQALTDSRRAWENKHGVCDEIATVYASMLRGMGIPTRCCAGLVNEVKDGKVVYGGGHAWNEFYLPNVGWVPVDGTWGATNEPIPMDMSPMAARRQISFPDYYFGKSDPYRITLVKDWNTELQPPPKTPGADKIQPWFVCQVNRRSGVHNVTSGFEAMPGISTGGLGWMRSEAVAENDFDFNIELLGPPSKAELDPVIKEIEAEGGHFRRVPYGIGGNFPRTTTDVDERDLLPHATRED